MNLGPASCFYFQDINRIDTTRLPSLDDDRKIELPFNSCELVVAVDASLPTLVDQLQIVQEPRGLLGRYFLALETEAAALGIRFRLVPFSELAAVYERTSSSWPALSPVVDCRVTNIPEATSACIIGYDADGAPAVTHALRLLDFKNGTVKTAFEDLTFWHGDRAEQYRSTVECSMTAPSATAISGRALYIGAFWVRTDLRGSGVGPAVQELARAYGLSQWDYDHVVTIGTGAIVRPENQKRYGFDGYEDGFELRRSGYPPLRGFLLWSRRQTDLDRLRALVEHGRADAQLLERDGGQQTAVPGAGP